jgi:hypothetical protein
MPCFQILSIGLLSTVPRPGFRGQRVLPRVQATRTELPSLTRLIYRGFSAYVEALLSRIRSPRMEDVDISLFNQLTLDIPRTCTFLHDLDTLRPTRAHVDFAESSVHITLSAPQPTASPDIFLSVSCARLDFQLSSMAQLCAALSASLEPAEKLVLGYYGGSALPEEWRDEVDMGLWRALLAPFCHVGTLPVHVPLVDDIQRALKLGPADQLLLPEMREIVLMHASDENALNAATAALGTFVDERDSAGCPVKVSSLDLSRLAETRREKMVSLLRLTDQWRDLYGLAQPVKAVSSRRRVQKL